MRKLWITIKNPYIMNAAGANNEDLTIIYGAFCRIVARCVKMGFFSIRLFWKMCVVADIRQFRSWLKQVDYWLWYVSIGWCTREIKETSPLETPLDQSEFDRT